jgi:hypothetical protein
MIEIDVGPSGIRGQRSRFSATRSVVDVAVTSELLELEPCSPNIAESAPANSRVRGPLKIIRSNIVNVPTMRSA